MADDDAGYLIGIIIVVAVVVFIAYWVTVITAVGGSLWGGGWAVYNYAESFKENMIDSNRNVVAANTAV